MKFVRNIKSSMYLSLIAGNIFKEVTLLNSIQLGQNETSSLWWALFALITGLLFFMIWGYDYFSNFISKKPKEKEKEKDLLDDFKTLENTK